MRLPLLREAEEGAMKAVELAGFLGMVPDSARSDIGAAGARALLT